MDIEKQAMETMQAYKQDVLGLTEVAEQLNDSLAENARLRKLLAYKQAEHMRYKTEADFEIKLLKEVIHQCDLEKK